LLILPRLKSLFAQKSSLTYLCWFQAYLSSIVVYLYAHDFKEAEKCYNDCSQ
jgi:hypothetical protein